jgi:hypothetical protein
LETQEGSTEADASKEEPEPVASPIVEVQASKVETDAPVEEEKPQTEAKAPSPKEDDFGPVAQTTEEDVGGRAQVDSDFGVATVSCCVTL